MPKSIFKPVDPTALNIILNQTLDQSYGLRSTLNLSIKVKEIKFRGKYLLALLNQIEDHSLVLNSLYSQYINQNIGIDFQQFQSCLQNMCRQLPCMMNARKEDYQFIYQIHLHCPIHYQTGTEQDRQSIPSSQQALNEANHFGLYYQNNSNMFINNINQKELVPIVKNLLSKALNFHNHGKYQYWKQILNIIVPDLYSTAKDADSEKDADADAHQKRIEPKQDLIAFPILPSELSDYLPMDYFPLP